MELINLVTQNKKIIVNVVVGIIFLFVANNVYKAQNKENQSLREKCDTEIKKVDILGQIKTSEAKIDSYKKSFPAQEASIIIEAINNAAKELSVNIDSIRPGTESKEEEYVKDPFSVSITVDNYHELGKFVAKIENMQNLNLLVEQVNTRFYDREKKLKVNLTISNIAIL